MAISNTLKIYKLKKEFSKNKVRLSNLVILIDKKLLGAESLQLSWISQTMTPERLLNFCRCKMICNRIKIILENKERYRQLISFFFHSLTQKKIHRKIEILDFIKSKI